MANTTDTGNYHTCCHPHIAHMFVLWVKVINTIKFCSDQSLSASKSPRVEQQIDLLTSETEGQDEDDPIRE